MSTWVSRLALSAHADNVTSPMTAPRWSQQPILVFIRCTAWPP